MDIRKLQRAIVDGLEDVKAQDIVVYNTEHLSPLFERVVIASGTSNRQTKALASSVRDAVRTLGEPVLSVEGEDNGEWIIVDCGAAVAHIMQPAIREYYRLEEIWGGKPVKLKGTTAKTGLVKASEPVDEPEEEAPPKKRGAARKKAGAGKPGASGRKAAPAEAAAPEAKATPRRKAAPSRQAAPAKKATPAGKAAPAKKARPVREVVSETVVVKPAAKKVAAKRATPGKAPATKAPARKAPANKAPAKKAAARRPAAKPRA